MSFITYLTIAVGISYAYFWFWLIWSIINPNWFYKQPSKSWIKYKNQINLIFQFTTKGGNWKVIQRGIRALFVSNLEAKFYQILVVTESQEDIDELKIRFNINRIKYIKVPKEYQTPNKTQYKARGLHYAVEKYKQSIIDNNTYIVHFDEESVIESKNIRLLYDEINQAYLKGVDITCGCIYYPLEYKDANILCRSMEANRAFVEPECAMGCLTGLPKQGHGSNMVVRQTIECATGWDIGLSEGHPIISEDILFLIQAKAAGAKFGWHGVPMIEQPAFTVDQSLKQRYRWVFGSLQALAVTKDLKGWNKLTKWQQFNMSTAIALRCFSYAMGFIIGLISLISNIVLLSILIISGQSYWQFNLLSGLFLFFWIGAYQYGVYMNLKFTNYSIWYKFKEHILIGLLSPIAGLYETFPALHAVFDWYILRKRSVTWKPTKKTK